MRKKREGKAKCIVMIALGFVVGAVAQALVDTSHPTISTGVSPQCEWATATIDRINQQNEEHRSTGKNFTHGKRK